MKGDEGVEIAEETTNDTLLGRLAGSLETHLEKCNLRDVVHRSACARGHPPYRSLARPTDEQEVDEVRIKRVAHRQPP